MGIDVYLKWENQTPEEEKAQVTGFSIEDGHNGYLRESYGGNVSAMSKFLTEDWDEEFEVNTEELTKRLPATLEACRLRYGDTSGFEKASKSYADFIELAKTKEKETGKPCRVYVSY